MAKPSRNLPILRHQSDADAYPERRAFLKRLLVGSSAVMLGPSIAGCVGDDDEEPTPDPGDPDDPDPTPDPDAPGEDLVLARAGDADILDPHSTTYVYSSDVMNLIYDPLTLMDGDGNIVECLGQPWEVSDDGLEWDITVNVDRDIVFHNGDELTVDDVVFTFNRHIEESLSGWTVGPLNEVERIDDETARFHFDEPHAPFEVHMTVRRYLGVLPQGPVEDDPDHFARNPIGTGPYMLDDWVEGDHIRLVRNEHYDRVPTDPIVEADDPPLPESLTFQVIPEDLPRVESLLTGDVDMIVDDFPIHEIDTIRDDPETEVVDSPHNRSAYVTMNVQKYPTDEIEVRQAIVQAINKDVIIEDIFRGQGSPNWVPISENLFGWAGDAVRDQFEYDYDPDASQQLLEDAGWEDVGGDVRERDGEPLEISMVSMNEPLAYRQTAEEIMAMLTDVGIGVDFTTLESTTAYERMGDGDFNVMGFANVRWIEPAVLNFLWGSHVIGISNRMHLDDPEVDDLLAQSNAAIDRDEREQLLEEVQLAAMAHYPCAPLFTEDFTLGVRSDLEGVKIHPRTNLIKYYDIHR